MPKKRCTGVGGNLFGNQFEKPAIQRSPDFFRGQALDRRCRKGSRESTDPDATRCPKWTVAQLIDGWLATSFVAAMIIPTVILLQRMAVGTTLAIWWSVTLPCIGLVAIVAYLAARCLQQRPLRFRLRALMIAMSVVPPLIAFVWFNARLVLVVAVAAVPGLIYGMIQLSTHRAIWRSVERSIREGKAALAQRRKQPGDMVGK